MFPKRILNVDISHLPNSREKEFFLTYILENNKLSQILG